MRLIRCPFAYSPKITSYSFLLSKPDMTFGIVNAVLLYPPTQCSDTYIIVPVGLSALISLPARIFSGSSVLVKYIIAFCSLLTSYQMHFLQ